MKLIFTGLAIFVAALVAAPNARAQAAPEALTWMVLNELNSAYFDRAEPFNRPPLVTEVPAGVIRPVDISHDGVPDWLIDYTDSGLMVCGTGGCLRTLYVSVPEGGHVLAFDEQTFTFDIDDSAGETVIDTDVHHVFCVPDDWDCSYGWAWDARLGRLVERPNRLDSTLLSGGGIDPIGRRDSARELDGLPVTLSRLWRGTRTTCATTNNDDGVEIRRAVFRSVPDLNGDGVRDWTVSPPYPCDTDPDQVVPEPPFQVFVSTPDGEVVEAFTSEPDQRPSFDIAATPAQLIANPPCGQGQACPNIRLRWDARAGRFVPSA